MHKTLISVCFLALCFTFLKAQSGLQHVFSLNSWGEGYDIIETSQGTFLITGRVLRLGSNSDYDAFLLEVDSMGTMLAKAEIGGPEAEFGYLLKEISPNQFIWVGRTDSWGAGNSDIFIAKVSLVSGSAINVQQIKTVGGTSPAFNFGGFEVPSEMEETPEGTLMIIGSTDSEYSTNGLGNGDHYVIEIDTNINILLSFNAGAIPYGSEYGISGIRTQNGGYALNGHSSNGAQLVILDSLNNISATRAYGITNAIPQEVSYGFHIAENPDGTLLLFAHIPGMYPLGGTPVPPRLLMLKVDASGNAIWSRLYRTPNLDTGPAYDIHRNTVALLPDSTFIVGGTHQNDSVPELPRPFLMRINREGEVMWRKTYPASEAIYLNRVRVSPSGKIIATGTVRFDQQVPTFSVWTMVTNSDGDACQAVPHTTDTLPHTLIVTNPGRDSINFGGDSILSAQNSHNTTMTTTYRDGCILFSTADAAEELSEITLFPNPANGGFQIRAESPISSVELFDLTGRKLSERMVGNEKEVQISTRNIPAGIILVKIHSARGQATRKVAIRHP